MYHASDPVFVQCVAILEGRYSLPSDVQKVVDQLSEICNARILNFYLHTVTTSGGYRQQHVILITERNATRDALDRHSPRQGIIRCIREFLDEAPGKVDKLRKDFFPRRDGEYPETVVAFCALEEVELRTAYARAVEEIRAICARNPVVWQVTQNEEHCTIFCYTDAQCAALASDSVLKEKLASVLRQYDRFGLFGAGILSRMYFDSKENLEANFQGQIYYYYK